MSRSNLQPILALPDGAYLVVSTQSLSDGDFTCALYSATFGTGDDAAFRMVSTHMAAPTCVAAQQSAYEYAMRIYPGAGATMKKPPYLIWRGPLHSAQA